MDDKKTTTPAKAPKRLVLKTETLRQLSNTELDAVNGGATPTEIKSPMQTTNNPQGER